MSDADRKRFEEIIYRINKINGFVSGITDDEFYRNELLKDACHANLIIISEALARMSNEVKMDYQEISWKEITGFRNLIVHEYFRINWITVWQVITEDLKSLRLSIQKILNIEED
jgi:uncharacterized protein with HEPN domain